MKCNDLMKCRKCTSNGCVAIKNPKMYAVGEHGIVLGEENMMN
jgi:hypothetical protein